MTAEPIENVMWRTMKILRVFDKSSLHGAINLTHDCHIKRITRYINNLNRVGLVCHTKNGWMLSSTAPAQAPMFRSTKR